MFKILNELFNKKGYLQWELDAEKFNGIEQIYNNEQIIQRYIRGTLNKESEVPGECIKYAKEQKNKTELWNLKLRYLFFLAKVEKVKYPVAKELIILIVGRWDEFVNMSTLVGEAQDELFKRSILSDVLKYSSAMKICEKEVWEKSRGFIKAKPNNRFFLIKEIVNFLNRSQMINCISNELEEYVIEIEMLLYRSNIERYYDLLIESIIDKKMRQNYILKKGDHLIYIAKHESGMRRIEYSRRAAEIFKNEKLREKEQEALAILEHAIEVGAGMQKISVELSEKSGRELQQYRECVRYYFMQQDIDILEKIDAMGNGVSIHYREATRVIYQPIAEVEKDDNVEVGILELFSSTIMDGKKIVSVGGNPFNSGELTYQIHKVANIIPAMKGLQEDPRFTILSIMRFIQEKLIISQRNIEFIKEALDLYMEKRYIGYICILVPTIESVLRDIYRQINGTDLVVKGTNMELQAIVNLTEILKDRSIKERLGEDTISYINYLLNDEGWGYNIRNNVAHGFEDIEFYNEEKAELLLHLIIVIVCRARLTNKLVSI